MTRKLRLGELEALIASDEKLFFTLLSYAIILVIFTNLCVLHSWLLGGITSIIYISINGIFLGHAFFEKEGTFLRFMLGNLLLVLFLGLTSWAIMIIYNLDTIRSAIVLCITAFVASLLNKGMKSKNVTK